MFFGFASHFTLTLICPLGYLNTLFFFAIQLFPCTFMLYKFYRVLIWFAILFPDPSRGFLGAKAFAPKGF